MTKAILLPLLTATSPKRRATKLLDAFPVEKKRERERKKTKKVARTEHPKLVDAVVEIKGGVVLGLGDES